MRATLLTTILAGSLPLLAAAQAQATATAGTTTSTETKCAAQKYVAQPAHFSSNVLTRLI